MFKKRMAFHTNLFFFPFFLLPSLSFSSKFRRMRLGDYGAKKKVTLPSFSSPPPQLRSGVGMSGDLHRSSFFFSQLFFSQVNDIMKEGYYCSSSLFPPLQSLSPRSIRDGTLNNLLFFFFLFSVLFPPPHHLVEQRHRRVKDRTLLPLLLPPPFPFPLALFIPQIIGKMDEG